MRHILQQLPAFTLALLPSLAHGQFTQDDIARDNVSGRFLMYEVSPTKPVLFAPDGSVFYITNQLGDRLAIYDTASRELILEVPTGPGLVSLKHRPGTSEVWMVDSVTSSLTIYDTRTKQIVHTVRVGAEPSDLVFTAAGDRAYVSCSAVDRVDVIDTANYVVAHSIAIPARKPHALARIGSSVYVVPLLSGNGTAPLGDTALGEAVRVARVTDIPGAQPLPDRDLLKINVTGLPTTDELDNAATISGLGTTLFNLHRRPGSSELWIPNTDALNALHRGEKAFIAGQVVRNRLTVVDLAQTPPSVRIVDLDALAPAVDQRVSTPTSVAFMPDGSRAFVTGYGTDRVAVLDIDAQGAITWAGSIAIHSISDYPQFSGPRGCAVSSDGEYLVTYNSVENGFARVQLPTLPTSTPFDFQFQDSLKIGFDRMPKVMKRGRGLFNSTKFSLSNTSACFSCHTDGDTDGLAWDLSGYLDPETTPADQLQFGVDVKGPMVTQSVRSVRETGPYHWRGERRALSNFNATFKNLLEHTVNGQPATIGGGFVYLQEYLEELVIAPNPRQDPSRRHSTIELQGADLFLNRPVQGEQACGDCHQLPLGTTNEVVQTFRGGESPSIVVPALRNIARKLNTPMTVGAAFGERTELGAGLNHGGTAPSIDAVALELDSQGNPMFQVGPSEAGKIARFIESLDTGLAPSTGFQVTMHAGNVQSVLSNELPYLMLQAGDGECDVIFVTGPEFLFQQEDFVTGMFIPQTERFALASNQLPHRTLAQLVDTANGGAPVTFIGVARRRGKVMGLDRDNDDIYDLDEAARGTNPESWDTDGDQFPDGYELEWGMDPLVPTATSPDSVGPEVIDGPHVVYTTQTSIKIEFETSELARILFFVDGTAVLRRPLNHEYDTHFSYPIGGLNPQTVHTITMEMTDPNENRTCFDFDHETSSFVRPTPIHVEQIALQIMQSPLPTRRNKLLVRVNLGGDAGPAAASYDIELSAYYTSEQAMEVIAAEAHAVSTGHGAAVALITIPNSIPWGQGTLTVVVQGVTEPDGFPSYIEADNNVSLKSTPY
ncbi:MAG: DNA-binding beta-propeller fold protein YncE [Planctomycetota bacterium]|jgi:DNA-binding beta-propeller fold protein YncE